LTLQQLFASPAANKQASQLTQTQNRLQQLATFVKHQKNQCMDARKAQMVGRSTNKDTVSFSPTPRQAGRHDPSDAAMIKAAVRIEALI
jgi:uncharacterized protein YdhG (YjbR/CyaY superfamily)